MGDSWEEEDFDVPILPVASNNKFNEEEEDETIKEQQQAVVKPKVLTEAQIKAQEAEEASLVAKMQFALQENETVEEKRLREKKQMEDADTALAGDLFSGAAKPPVAPASSTTAATGSSNLTKGLGSISLKTKQDHTSYGIITSKKLAQSSAFNVAAFYKSLSGVLNQPTMTSEVLDEIMKDIKTIRDAKAQSEAKAAKAQATKKSKKQIQAEVQAHSDKFGGSSRLDREDDYIGMEDDFM